MFALCDDKTPGSPSPDPLYNLYSCNLNKQGLICLLESFLARELQAGLDHCSVDAEFEKETELKVI